MTVFGLPWATAILIFGWIPLWWIVAAVALHRMNRNDERNRDRSDAATETGSGGDR